MKTTILIAFFVAIGSLGLGADAAGLSDFHYYDFALDVEYGLP
jgi:hypothetical protein